MSFAFLFFAYYLAFQKKYFTAIFFSFLGSFSSYGSPPIALALSLIFLLKKEYKKMLIMILPNIGYIAYVIYLTRFNPVTNDKIGKNIELFSFLKYYLVQIGTFFDVSFGPSLWVKVYYSIKQLSFLSFTVWAIAVIIFIQLYETGNKRISKKVFLSLIVMTFLSFGMLSLTGFYPQIAFNLCNRVTIYGSFLLSFVLVAIVMNNKITASIFFAFFLMVVLGISDHWKNWNDDQLKIFDNISENEDLKKIESGTMLFVSYNQYSRLGRLTHIEFFEGGIASRVLRLATNRNYKVSNINKRFYYENDKLIDKKFGSIFQVSDYIHVYDSKADKVLKIEKDNIQNYIDSLPANSRHWLLLLGKDTFLMKIVLKLMPRLEYVF
ncbi:MAG: hypothetical protein ABIJ59_06475 [Pseudomonadota bacterium]